MRTLGRKLFAAASLLLCVATPALGQPASPPPPVTEVDSAPGPADDEPGCDGAGFVGSAACHAVGGVLGGIGGFVASGASLALSGIVSFVADGASWLLEQVTGFIDRSTRPDLSAPWFTAAYRDVVLIAGLGLLPFLLLAFVQGLIRQDLGMLTRAAFVYVPVAAVGTAGGVVVTDLLVQLTDEMSAWVARSMGRDLSAFATGLGSALREAGAASAGAIPGMAMLLGAGLIAFATFVVWLELLLRQAAIYVAVLFLPLGFMALVWPATAHWLRRLVDGLVAIILSKFVIVAVMAMAAGALDADIATEGYATVISGGALLSLAALAPYVLLRLIPVFEAGLSSHLEGTVRRPTAAVSPSAAGGGSVVSLIRQRGGGGVGASGAPVLVGTASGAGGVVAAGGGLVAGAAGGAVQRVQASSHQASDVATSAQGTSAAQGGMVPGGAPPEQPPPASPPPPPSPPPTTPPQPTQTDRNTESR